MILSKLGVEEHPEDNRWILAVLAYLDGRANVTGQSAGFLGFLGLGGRLGVLSPMSCLLTTGVDAVVASDARRVAGAR